MNHSIVHRSANRQQACAAAGKPASRSARSAVAHAVLPRCRRCPLWQRCGLAVLAVLAHATAAAGSCSGQVELSATSEWASFTDGSAAAETYENYSNCEWLVSAPAGATIELEFTRFETGSGFGFVSVHDGASAAAVTLGTFDGSATPAALASSGSALLVRFTSGEIEQMAGFEARFRIMACRPGTHSSSGRGPCTGTPCATGRFGPAMQTSAAAATCANCEAGRFSVAAGSTVCTACPVGKWQNDAASSTCVACAAGRFSALEASISDTCADCAAELFSFGGASACCAPGLVAVGGVPCTSDASALLAASDTIVLGAGTFTWLTEQTIASKNVTIVGAGASSTIIDAQGKTRLFMITSGGHVAVKNVTITGGEEVRVASDCASLLLLLCALC